MKPPTSQTPSTDIPDSLDLIPISTANRRKAGQKAKRKGSTYERTLCKVFGALWGSKFFRTPMSGGSQLKHDYNLAGDISTPDETFPYHVEAKNQEALKSFHNIFVSKKCPVWKWWGQATTECPVDKIPLLIFTRNYMPSFVMMPLNYGGLLECAAGFSLGEFIRVENCALMTLDKFLLFDKGLHERCSREYLSWEGEYALVMAVVPLGAGD
jgi:hypothetical protein